MHGVGWHAPLGLEAHAVVVVVEFCEVLLPEGLHALDRPRVVCVREVDRIKVHHPLWVLVREAALRLGHQPREDHRLPLVGHVHVAQLRRAGALLAQLRVRERGHVADHHARRMARLAQGEDEPLAAARVAQLGRERDGQAKGGLGVHPRGRAGEHDVQVVHRRLVQRRPAQVRRGVGGQRRLHARQHQKVRARRAQVGGLVRPREVQLARDVRRALRCRTGFALRGAVAAHVARAALARGQQVAALAARGAGDLVHRRPCAFARATSHKTGHAFFHGRAVRTRTQHVASPQRGGHLGNKKLAILLLLAKTTRENYSCKLLAKTTREKTARGESNQRQARGSMARWHSS